MNRLSKKFLYLQLADELERKIKAGDFTIGSKLPSVRMLHRKLGLSITTVYEALIELERRNFVEAQPRSGFFVRKTIQSSLKAPKLKKHRFKPHKVQVDELVESIFEAMDDHSVIQFGGAAPATELLPVKRLSRAMCTVSNREINAALEYGIPQGHTELRSEIAKRIFGHARDITADQIVVTNGCQESLSLCLRAVTKPGDTVVIESPTFPGMFALLEDLKLKALEIPTHPETGIDLESLERAIEEHVVKAGIFIPNIHNPLGYIMAESNKKYLVQMFNEKNIPIIEDGVYHDLYSGSEILPTMKTYDKKDLVMFCSSFSKTIAPGLRIGWTIPGKFKKTIIRFKLNSSITCSCFNQLVILECLKTGFYDRHLRKMRNSLKIQMAQMTEAIARYFPEDTKITKPKGGLLLWIKLYESIDSFKVFSEALKQRVSILPGLLFSNSNRFKNCIRINCGHPWRDKLEHGIATLGKIIKQSN